MLLLGIDLGTSSVKVSVVDAASQQCLASVQYPDTETPVQSPQPGWAEQSPEEWWKDVQWAILKANATGRYNPKDIGAIGIAYQMHGLVCVDKQRKVLRPSIIWCDSRAVSLGEKAFKKIGEKKSLSHLLNSPGNFTASKLAWVKENEPDTFSKVARIMLPGDFIAMRLTGEATTSISALSEGIFWDFKKGKLSKDILHHFGFDTALIPPIQPVFSEHGRVSASVADALSLTVGIPVTYKAGDQPNNALSLNVLEPGEVAATAGTSGVIYGVSDELTYDKQSRINSFAHVNHTEDLTRIGVLLCINGCGITNRWIKSLAGNNTSYDELNKMAASVPVGSHGLLVMPFGNGAERMLNNKQVGAGLLNIDLNTHTLADLYRAGQEGIAFAFRYGLDIMRENGMDPRLVRAGQANMFLSPLFREAFANITNCRVELYDTDGATGAARAAGMAVACFSNFKECFSGLKKLMTVEPDKKQEQYEEAYQHWQDELEKRL